MCTMLIITSKINSIYLTFPKGATALNSIIFVRIQNLILFKNSFKIPLKVRKYSIDIFRRKGIKRLFKENILESDGNNKSKALSIALGIFIGVSPFGDFILF